MNARTLRNVFRHLVGDPRLALVSARKTWGHVTEARHQGRMAESAGLVSPFFSTMEGLFGPSVDIGSVIESRAFSDLVVELEQTPLPNGSEQMGGPGFLKM